MYMVHENEVHRSFVLSYCFHSLLAFPVSLVPGFIFEYFVSGLYADNRTIAAFAPGAALVAGLCGLLLNSIRRDQSAVFVFVPPLLYFLDSWYELTKAWSPSWSKQSHSEYVMNNLFGPSCANTECLYTLGTATVLAAIFYSIGALFGRRLNRNP
jgi:hypothetical protein